MKRHPTQALLVVLPLILGTLAVANDPPATRILNVPSVHSSIQAAIDASHSGDSIIVEDGKYGGAGNTDLDFKGKSIILKSRNGPKQCTIDCQGTSRGFLFHSSEGKDSVLSGFTIQSGVGKPLGRNWAGFEPTVGGAILCDGSAPTIENNIFLRNSAQVGGAICCFNASTITIRSNLFLGNTSAIHGGAIYLNGCRNGLIERNTLDHNKAKDNGGGICTQNGSSPLLQYNNMKHNTARSGGAISISNGAPPIANNLFAENGSTGATDGPFLFDGGGALRLWNASILAINNTFVSNTARLRGGAVEQAYTANARFVNNIFWNNSALAGNHLYVSYYQSDTKFSSSLTVEYCLLQGGKASCIVEEECAMQDSNNVDGDPQFVDAMGHDYRLKTGSPCIDCGAPNEIYNADIRGVQRPMGAKFDIGAYEYAVDEETDTSAR